MQGNWQQGQYGGYGQQQQQQQQQQPTGGGGGFMGPQPTGFGGMGMGMGMQPTGYGGGMGQQPTGMGMGGMGMSSQPTGFQQQQRPPSNVSPLPTGQQQFGGAPGGTGNYSFLNSQPTGFRPSGGLGGAAGGGMNPQMTGFAGGGASGLLSQPTGFGGGGMMSQPTGGLMSQPTGMGGLRAQPTGVHDPRLQTMMQSFMPSNMSQPFNPSGVPQFQSTQQPLQQQFQSLLQNPSVKTPKVPWVLTKQEKKDYDQIFRAWDTDGDGFITGETSREVFGQAGLDQDSLMKIWTLSDVDNRGKLNLPEFHVAMGLIYRALNGNEIPDRLPEELIPASTRDIDTTVSFMRDLLKHESNTRSNTSSPSFGASTPVGGGKSKDATAYKHDDSRPSGYKPSSRHLDRKSVRYSGEDSSADIGDIRRQLANTSAMLDKSNDDYVRKTEEDEQLEQDVDDLKYRVKRIQDDIEYLTKGRRSADKDEERRKLEREMLFLMHEKLPELERRQQQREEDKRREERAGTRARDRRNDTHGRYGGGRGGDDRDDDRDWLRGSYDRDRDRDRDSYRRDDRDRDRYDDRSRDRSRERDRDRYDRDRPRSPPRSRTPPPAPPPAPPVSTSAPPPPAPPAPTSNATAAPSTKNMTPEERSAFIREQAQRRIQERLKALGVESSSDQPAVDKSVEERLEREKREAEEKSKSAEKEQEAREEARRQRLQGGGGPSPSKAGDEESTTTAAPAAPASPAVPLKSAMKKAPAAPPAPPTSRSAKAPPPAPKSRPHAPASPAPAKPAPEEEEEDPEEAELRRKEEARQKAKEDRKARLAALEAEEEEERKQEEARLAARQARSTPAASPAPPAAAQSPPPPPPAPPAPPAPSATGGSADHNPFRKPGHPTAPAAGGGGGGFNPFFKPQGQAASPSPAASPAAGITSPPPPPPPPAPPAPTARAAPAPADDEWERIEEKTDDSDADSSDDDYANSRSKRAGLASALFGNITGGPRSGSSTPTAPPAPKGPPPAALANLGGGQPSGGGMSALLSSIQGGARLKKATTVDKSAPGVTGRIIGGADVPEHINAGEPPATNGQADDEEEVPDETVERNPNRQSVDWLGGLAADHSRPSDDYTPLEATKEVDEPAVSNGTSTPSIQVEQADELDEFDLTKTVRVRTLFPYDGQRDVDLSFIENVVIEAHPAKDPQSPWWYGTLVKEGKKGWFPHTYVDELKPIQAKASFTYDGQSEDELPFVEGDVLTIVDTSDDDWWKTEKAGVIFIVPASYFELLAEPKASTTPSTNHRPLQLQHQHHEDLPHITTSPPPASNSSPPLALPSARPRSSTLNSATSGYESSSSEDSMLSFWSSDDDSETEDTTTGPDDEDAVRGKEDKEEERRKREGERHRRLEQAGLKIRREPPSVPGQGRRRRPAPAAPGQGKKPKRRAAPGVPPTPASSSATRQQHPSDLESQKEDSKLDTLDAYARYENYLAQTRDRANSTPMPTVGSSTPLPTPIAAQHSGASASTRPARSSSVTHSPQSSTGGGGGGRFSGLISRIMAPTASEPARKPISIVRVDEGDGSGRASPTVDAAGTPPSADMGRTWTSLVESSVLGTMSDKERKRQEAIFEFIATEGSYNRDLQLIVEVFYASMLDMLDEKALTVIFANVEDILLTATAFLSSLEQRQKSCRLYVDVIGDILEEHIPRMRVYMTYCVNQQQAIKLLQSQRESNPALAAHLQSIRESNPSVRGLDLSSFLLIPMQRITRYPLLLRQILQYTASDQDFPAVQAALSEAESITAAINESVREAEGDERLRVLSEDLWIGGEGRLDLTAPTAYQGPRKLLKEGLVSKAKSGRKLTMVLCNDILVLIESRNLYRMPIPLHEVQAREGREEAFQLKVEFQRGGDTIGLKASSSREAKEWVSLINKHRADTLDARNEVDRQRHHGFSF